MRRFLKIFIISLVMVCLAGLPVLANNEAGSQYRLLLWYNYYGSDDITVPQKGSFSTPQKVRVQYGSEVIEEMTTSTIPPWIYLDGDWVNGKTIKLLEIPAPDGYELCFSHQPEIRFGEGMFRLADPTSKVVDVMIPIRKAGEQTDFSQTKVLVNVVHTINQGIQYKYTGKAIKPPVQVYLNNLPLQEGIDYTLDYRNNVNMGNAYVVVKGIGNFKGVKEKLFQVTDFGTVIPGSEPAGSGSTGSNSNTGSAFTSGGLNFSINSTGNATVSGTVNSQDSVIKIPNTVTINGTVYKVTAVEPDAFKNNNAVSAVIGDNVSSIGSNAFYGCKKLKTVTIGSKVSMIGVSAFGQCKNLRSIKVKSKLLTLKKTGKGAFKKIFKAAKFKVPKKKARTYRKIFQKRGAGKKIKVTG